MMIKPPAIIRIYFFLPCLVLVLFFLHLTGEASYAEDLVLSGNDVMVIENITYSQTGNIIIQDNARLSLKNSTLLLNLSYHEEFRIYISGNGALEVMSSNIKSGIVNENIIINITDETTLTVQDSDLNEGAVYFIFGTRQSGDNPVPLFKGNASIINSKFHTLDLIFSPLGGGSFSVIDSQATTLGLSFRDNYTGEFSNLNPGTFTLWTYHNGDYNISIENTSFMNIGVASDGPSSVIVHNSDLFAFAPYAPLSTISMKAVDSKIYGIALALNGSVELWGLKTGLHSSWKLSEHSTGDSVPELILENTEIQSTWSVLGFSGIQLWIDDSMLKTLRTMGSTHDVTVTNSAVDELMLYNSMNTIYNFNNTTMTNINTYVPPNSVTINGNINFTQEAQIQNWYSPSEITRTYEVVVKDGDTPVEGANLSLYESGNSQVWSGTTNGDGKANFTLHFTDTNYSNSWRLETSYLGAIKGQREIGLLTSTPIEIVFYDVTPSVFEGTIGTEITFTDPPSGFGSKKGKVLIGGVATKIAKDGWQPDSISCTVTKVPSVGPHDVTIKPYKADEIRLPNAFTVKYPEIDSLDFYHGAVGDPIIISGNFFSTKKGKVYLENRNTGKKKNCKVISWGMKSITFAVPKASKSFPAGAYPLKVENKVGNSEAPTEFTVEQ